MVNKFSKLFRKIRFPHDDKTLKTPYEVMKTITLHKELDVRALLWQLKSFTLEGALAKQISCDMRYAEGHHHRGTGNELYQKQNRPVYHKF